VHASVEIASNIYEQKCIRLINKIVIDKHHYVHNQVTVLPHGHLKVVKCTMEGMRKTFLPAATRLVNTKYNR